MDIMKNFSLGNLFKVVVFFVALALTICLLLAKWGDNLTSQCFLGLSGAILVGITIAAGLGLCALLRLPFNASTTQIMPFLALGCLSMYSLFLLVTCYSDNLKLDHSFEVC